MVVQPTRVTHRLLRIDDIERAVGIALHFDEDRAGTGAMAGDGAIVGNLVKSNAEFSRFREVDGDTTAGGRDGTAAIDNRSLGVNHARTGQGFGREIDRSGGTRSRTAPTAGVLR